MKTVDLEDKFTDAVDEAKAILDMLEVVEGEPLADGTLTRVAHAAYRRIEEAEKYHAKLFRKYCRIETAMESE